MKPYPEYRDSGVAWLGPVPAHWEVRRNGRLFAQRVETGFAELPILEVSLKTGVRVRDMDNLKRKQVMSDRDKYKRAAEGDIAYNMMRMWQGAVGVAPVDGLVSPAYVVARPFEDTDSRYFSYLFRTSAYMAEVDGYSRGIVKDRNRLYWEDFKRMPSCVPPPDEQRRIADHLDAHGRFVQRFIRNRRRLIEVLNEQKQAIIDRLVTRGLDPSVRLKPSGIAWLEIPAEWEVNRLRNVAELVVSNVDKHTHDGEIPVRLCNYVDVYKNRRITGDLPFMAATASPDEVRRFRLHRGDVVVTKDSEIWTDIAVPALVDYEAEDFVCGYHLAILRPFERMRSAYLLHVLQAKSVVVQFHVEAQGVTRFGLSHSAIKNVIVPYPTPAEQDAIVAAIEEQTRDIDCAIRRTLREIELIREYRTRLISEVVTGKIDVREATEAAAAEPRMKPKRAANIHFRRAVFAAEIVHRLHGEPTFGHVKFEKLIFLCEKRCGVDTGSTYNRHAAGPYDSRALRSIDSQLRKQQWFEAQKGDNGYRYVPLDKVGSHREYFNRYFGNVVTRFDEVIDTFRTLNTQRCEIVATLYAAWDDLLTQHANVTDDEVVRQVLHNWHPTKQSIDETRWRRALGWMKAKGLVPEGRTRPCP